MTGLWGLCLQAPFALTARVFAGAGWFRAPAAGVDPGTSQPALSVFDWHSDVQSSDFNGLHLRRDREVARYFGLSQNR